MSASSVGESVQSVGLLSFSFSLYSMVRSLPFVSELTRWTSILRTKINMFGFEYHLRATEIALGPISISARYSGAWGIVKCPGVTWVLASDWRLPTIVKCSIRTYPRHIRLLGAYFSRDQVNSQSSTERFDLPSAQPEFSTKLVPAYTFTKPQ